MNNLQNDVMLIMGFHAPKGVEYQLNLLSSVERSIEINTMYCTVLLKAKKVKPLKGNHWSPLTMTHSVSTTVSDGGAVGMEIAAHLGELISYAVLVARFVESHPQWYV